MKVIINYPQQVKIGWSHRCIKILKNGKELKYLQQGKALEFELETGDVIHAQLGMMKSNVISIESDTELWMELSAFLRVDNIIMFISIMLISMLVSQLDFGQLEFWIAFGIFIILMGSYTFYMLKSPKIKIKETPL